MKEQRSKSDLQMKFNLINAKRNKLAAKVKEFEDLLKSRHSQVNSYSKSNQMRPSKIVHVIFITRRVIISLFLIQLLKRTIISLINLLLNLVWFTLEIILSCFHKRKHIVLMENK